MPERIGRIVNKSELADIFGVSTVAIDGWQRRGCPVKEQGAKRVGYKFDTAQVAEWRVETAVQKVTESASDGKKDPGSRKLTAEAALAELKLDREMQRLVPIADVERTWDQLTTACRARLLAIPARQAPPAFAAESVEDLRDLLEAAIHEALNELASRGIEASGVGETDADGSDESPAAEDETSAAPHRKRVGRPKSKTKSGGKRRTGPVGDSEG